MGADVLDVGMGVDHACRPASVPWDFRSGSSWVNGDGNLPAIELLENRIEFFVSNVSSVVVRQLECITTL